MKRPLISADCHVTEPLDLWADKLPASLRADGPRIEFQGGRGAFFALIRWSFPTAQSADDRPSNHRHPQWYPDRIRGYRT